MKWILKVLLVVVVAAGNACGEGCDANLQAGIVVSLIDGTTGNPLVGDVAVTATEGSYTETVNPQPVPAGPRTAALAFERPGIYRVEVQAPGYVTWVATNVRVIHDGCHVETVQLTAELELVGSN